MRLGSNGWHDGYHLQLLLPMQRRSKKHLAMMTFATYCRGAEAASNAGDDTNAWVAHRQGHHRSVTRNPADRRGTSCR